MAVVLAEFREGRKNPGAGIDLVGVDPARRDLSSIGLGAESFSGEEAVPVPFVNVRRMGRADGLTTTAACIGDISILAKRGFYLFYSAKRQRHQFSHANVIIFNCDEGSRFLKVFFFDIFFSLSLESLKIV